jgi:hypothetical protein
MLFDLDESLPGAVLFARVAGARRTELPAPVR